MCPNGVKVTKAINTSETLLSKVWNCIKSYQSVKVWTLSKCQKLWNRQTLKPCQKLLPCCYPVKRIQMWKAVEPSKRYQAKCWIVSKAMKVSNAIKLSNTVIQSKDLKTYAFAVRLCRCVQYLRSHPRILSAYILCLRWTVSYARNSGVAKWVKQKITRLSPSSPTSLCMRLYVFPVSGDRFCRPAFRLSPLPTT